MVDDIDNQIGPDRQERVLKRLDHMVESGRITDSEAERLRSASRPGQFEVVVRDIRLRHAGTRLADAVESGGMTQQEADDYLQRLSNGEHPRSLRAHLRKLLPERR